MKPLLFLRIGIAAFRSVLSIDRFALRDLVADIEGDLIAYINAGRRFRRCCRYRGQSRHS